MRVRKAKANWANELRRGRGHGPGSDPARSRDCHERRLALRLPDLDTVGIFILRDGIHRRHKLHGPHLAMELAVQAMDVRAQASGGHGAEVALGQLGFRRAKFCGQHLDAFLAGGEELLDEVLALDGPEISNDMLVFTAP